MMADAPADVTSRSGGARDDRRERAEAESPARRRRRRSAQTCEITDVSVVGGRGAANVPAVERRPSERPRPTRSVGWRWPPRSSRTMVACWRRPTIRGLDWSKAFCLLPRPTTGRSAPIVVPSCCSPERPETTHRAAKASRSSSTRPTTNKWCPAWAPSPTTPASAGRRVRRIALIHRTGVVPVGESAVIAVVSAPHRDEAFAAARFCIDALKATVPIWKREEWSGGASWGLEPQHITEVERLGGATA